jgi:acyl-CoA synthetase (AMP-forming)/AMP-acid ligase II
MVPSMTYQLLNHPEFSKVGLDNLESVSAGAGRMHNDLRERFEHRVNHVPFLTEGITIVT